MSQTHGMLSERHVTGLHGGPPLQSPPILMTHPG